MKPIFYSLIINLILLSACTETEYIDNPPQLEIRVFDRDGEKIQGALVRLYKTEQEWVFQDSYFANSTTNSDGVAIFKKLEEVNYYFLVKKDEMDNVFDVSYFERPLRINEKRIIDVTIK